jgi:hypothetical protein
MNDPEYSSRFNELPMEWQDYIIALNGQKCLIPEQQLWLLKNKYHVWDHIAPHTNRETNFRLKKKRGDKPLPRCYAGFDLVKLLFNHSKSQDRRMYYHFSKPFGKKKWIWWFHDRTAISRFRQCDGKCHEFLGCNEFGIKIDEIWEVTLVDDGFTNAVFTRHTM